MNNPSHLINYNYLAAKIEEPELNVMNTDILYNYKFMFYVHTYIPLHFITCIAKPADHAVIRNNEMGHNFSFCSGFICVHIASYTFTMKYLKLLDSIIYYELFNVCQ